MSLPSPLEAFTPGACSGVYQNTVYVYQPDAFQSLELTEGAEWKNLTAGVAAEGAKCVVGAQEGKDALFVVGGISNTPGYGGLQRYVFEDEKWDTIDTVDLNLQNRQMHGAAYLNSTNSMLIYAGYQDGQVQNSSQTFTFSLAPPFNLRAWTSTAPPVINPILLPWNQSHAVMAGGSPTNQQVWVFSEAGGWRQVPVVLPDGLPDMTEVQASLVQGTNGSKLLELFDLTQSPNKVTTLLVQPEEGEPFPTNPSTALTPRQVNNVEDKQVDLSQWPLYNDTEAPSEARTGYSLTQTPSGLVVITGGNDAQDPIAIFNQTGNTWVDASQIFTPQQARTDPETTPTPSPTDPIVNITPSPESSPDQQSSSDGGSRTRVLLGAILGSLFGLAALVLLGLLVLRCLKRRKERKNFGYNDKSSPNQMEIDDNAAAAAASAAVVPRGNSPDTIDSLKRGAVGKGMVSPPRPHQHLTNFPSVFTNPSPTPSDEERAVNQNRGWSSYFQSDDQSTSTAPQGGLAAVGAAPGTSTNNNNDRSQDESRLTTYTDASAYTTSTSGGAHESAEIPPLALRASSQAYPHGQNPANSEHDGTFLGESSTERTGSWSPLDKSNTWGDRRPISSMYDNVDTVVSGPVSASIETASRTSSSANGPHPGQRVLIGQFPAPGGGKVAPVSSGDGSSGNIGGIANGEGDRGLRTMATRNFGRASGLETTEEEDEGVSVKPGPVRSVVTKGEKEKKKEVEQDDMSWLNLGANK